MAQSFIGSVSLSFSFSLSKLPKKTPSFNLPTCMKKLTSYRKPISLVSHSDVRYRGILAGIDPHASTIQLSNGDLPSSSLLLMNLTSFFPPSSVFYGNRDQTVCHCPICPHMLLTFPAIDPQSNTYPPFKNPTNISSSEHQRSRTCLSMILPKLLLGELMKTLQSWP